MKLAQRAVGTTGLRWALCGLVLLVIGLGSLCLHAPPFLDDSIEWVYLASWLETGHLSSLDCFGYFRPIKNLLFACCPPEADGSNVAAHVLSLGAYVALTLVVWLAARRLLRSQGWALVLTALYVLAPTQLAAFAWFSCTSNVVMNTLLVLLTLLAAENTCQHWYARNRRGALVAGSLTLMGALLALASYEVAVALPGLFLLWQYARARPWLTRASLCLAGLLVLTVAAYLLVRARIQGIGSSAATGFFPPLSSAAVSFASAYFTVHHLGLWLWPLHRLTLFAGYPPAAALPPGLLPACWLLLLLITWVAFRLRGAIRFFWIGWLWFLGAFLPMSNLIPFRNGPFADYYLVLPGLGLALALTGLLRYGVQRWRAQASRFGLGLVVLLVLARLCTAGELPHGLWAWRQTQTLKRYLLQANPLNYVLLANWGNFCIRAGQLDTAGQLVDSAQELAPWFGFTWQLRGRIALQRTNYPAAFQCFQQAHALNPADAFPLKALGFTRQQQGQTDAAVAYYLQALDRHWDSDSVTLAIHVVRQLDALGRTREAEALWQRARHYAPHHEAVVLYSAAIRDAPAPQCRQKSD